MAWKQLLAWATGQIDQTLRQKLELVLEENRVYRSLLDRHSPQWRLEDVERKVLAEKGKPLGKLLPEVITIVQPATLLKWHRRLIAKKWDYSHRRQGKSARPPISWEIERPVVRFARENPGWGYDRIVGALANPGLDVSDQTVGNILRRRGLGPAPDRQRNTTWSQFIRRHKAVLWATDFFTTEVWTTSGLTTFYVLFFLELQTRRIVLGGISAYPHEDWMKQIVRNLTGVTGQMSHARFLLHDRDTKFSEAFDALFKSVGIWPISLPARSPNLNAYAERWVRSVKSECLDHLILFGERSLWHALGQYVLHHQHDRNHQGLDNVIPSPLPDTGSGDGKISKSERLGGLLNFYHRQAA